MRHRLEVGNLFVFKIQILLTPSLITIKKVIILLAVLFGVSAIQAQNTVDNPSNRAYFGLRAYDDIMFPCTFKASTSDGLKYDGDKMKTGGGIDLGGIYNLPLKGNLFLEPGISLYYNTNTVNFDDYFATPGPDSDYKIAFKSRMHRFGFRVPVMVGYHFDFVNGVRLSVFTGPELDLGIWSRQKKNYGIVESYNQYGDHGQYHRVGLNWNVGLGITYGHFFCGIKGAFGLLDMAKDKYILDINETSFDNVKLHENRMSIGIGYNF